jgi:hypothetical protein
MFWFVGKVFQAEDGIAPGTTAYSTEGEVRLATDYANGRVVEARCYDLGSVLVKWSGTPPMDWTQLTLPEACAHHLSKAGY